MAINLHLRNLSRLASNLDIRRFFIGLDIPEGGVQIVGGQDGDAFVAFSKEADLLKALNLDGKILLGQPVRLFLAKRSDMERVIQRRSEELSQAKRLRAGPTYTRTRSPSWSRSRSRSRSKSPDQPPPWLKSRGRINIPQRPVDRFSPEPKRRRMSGHSPSQYDRVETILRGRYDMDDRDEMSRYDDRNSRQGSDRDEWSGSPEPRRSRSPEIRSSPSPRLSDRSFNSDSDGRSVSDKDSVGEPTEYIEPGYIVIGNLPLTVTARDLRERFDQYEIANGGITMKSNDRDPNVLLAFVKFVSLKDAVKVDCTCEGLELHGRPMEIKMIKSSAYEATEQPLPSGEERKEEYPGPTTQHSQWPRGPYPPMYPGYPPAPGPHGFYPGMPRPPLYPPRGPPGGMCPYPAQPYPYMPGPYPYAGPMGHVRGPWTSPYQGLHSSPAAGPSTFAKQSEKPKQRDARPTANISVLEYQKSTAEGKQQAAIKQMPSTQFVGPYIQNHFYIRLNRPPADITACSLWESLGGRSGSPAGVLLFRELGGKPMHATIAYHSRDERDIAKGSKPNFMANSSKSDGPAVHNFLAQEIIHKYGTIIITESTDLGLDREISLTDKMKLLKSLPNKRLASNHSETLKERIKNLVQPEKPTKQSAPVSAPTVKNVQGNQSPTVSSSKSKDKVDAPKEKAKEKTGPQGLKGVLKARHLLRFRNLQPETTACEVWSWFDSANGPAAGALLVQDEEGKASYAFVILMRDYTEYRDKIRRDRYAAISKLVVMNAFHLLPSGYKVFESGPNGKDVQLCIEAQLDAIEPKESKKAKTEQKPILNNLTAVDTIKAKKDNLSEAVDAFCMARKDTTQKPIVSVAQKQTVGVAQTAGSGANISVWMNQSERKLKTKKAIEPTVDKNKPKKGASYYVGSSAIIDVSSMQKFS